MEKPHKVILFGNSLTIDEMYFRIDEIRFVDVVKKSYPLLRQLLILCTGCCALTALIFHDSFPDLSLFFTVCAVAQTTAVCSIRRRYALRIGQQFGTTKAIISVDRQRLEQIRLEILEALRKRNALTVSHPVQ